MDYYSIFSETLESLDFFVNKIYNHKTIEKLACVVLKYVFSVDFPITYSKNMWQS